MTLTHKTCKQMKILLCLLIGIACVTNTAACSCYETSPVKEAYSGAALVVVGKVVRLSYVGLAETMRETKRAQLEKKVSSEKRLFLTEAWITKVEIEIEQSFKGSPATGKVVVYTGRRGASCGYTQFKVGEKFVVYGLEKSDFYRLVTPEGAFREGLEKPGTYWTNHCLRTAPFSFNEVAALKEIKRG